MTSLFLQAMFRQQQKIQRTANRIKQIIFVSRQKKRNTKNEKKNRLYFSESLKEGYSIQQLIIPSNKGISLLKSINYLKDTILLLLFNFCDVLV